MTHASHLIENLLFCRHDMVYKLWVLILPPIISITIIENEIEVTSASVNLPRVSNKMCARFVCISAAASLGCQVGSVRRSVPLQRFNLRPVLVPATDDDPMLLSFIHLLFALCVSQAHWRGLPCLEFVRCCPDHVVSCSVDI